MRFVCENNFSETDYQHLKRKTETETHTKNRKLSQSLNMEKFGRLLFLEISSRISVYY